MRGGGDAAFHVVIRGADRQVKVERCRLTASLDGPRGWLVTLSSGHTFALTDYDAKALAILLPVSFAAESFAEEDEHVPTCTCSTSCGHCTRAGLPNVHTCTRVAGGGHVTHDAVCPSTGEHIRWETP